jgi:hypothetical protein
MSFQMPGNNRKLAATSNMKIDGTISAGVRTSDSAVMASSEKPNPE